MAAAEADVERDEEVAVLVAGRPEGELVVVAGHAPLVANGLVLVDHVVAVVVDQLGQLRPLHDVNVLAVHVQAERFVQAAGVELEFHVGGVVGVGIVDEPDFAAARAGQQLAVGPHGQAADFHDAVLGDGQRDDAVVGGLGAVGGRAGGGAGVGKSRASWSRTLAGHDSGNSGAT